MSAEIPKEIWLQVHGDCSSEEVMLPLPSDHFLGDVSWCVDQIFEHDVKYIRADIVEAENERLRRAAQIGLQAAEELAGMTPVRPRPEAALVWAVNTIRKALEEK